MQTIFLFQEEERKDAKIHPKYDEHAKLAHGWTHTHSDTHRGYVFFLVTSSISVVYLSI